MGVSVHLIAGFVLLVFYLSNGGTRWEAIPIHLLLVISLFTLLLLFWRWVFGFRTTNGCWKSHFFWFSHIALSFWILLLYLSSATGFILMSDQVSIRAFVNYLSTFALLADQMAIGQAVIVGAAGSLILVVVILWALWIRQLRRLPALFHSFPVTKAQRITGRVIAVFAVLVLGGFVALIQNERMNSLRSEPFANHFRSPSTIAFNHETSQLDVDRHFRERNRFTALADSLDPDELPNIVLIMLDSARADHMSLYGYSRPTTPFLDSLDRSGNLTKAAFATSTCTDSVCGITTTLSSLLLPDIHLLSYTFHELLADIGYASHFFLSGDHSQAYRNLERFYGDGLVTFKDGFSRSGQQPTDDEWVVRNMKGSLDSGDRTPAFFYIHLMSPHFSGIKYDKFTRYEPEYRESVRSLSRRVKRGEAGELDSLTLRRIVNTYDNRMIQSDDYIRRIFQTLQEKGILDNSIVVITSDHGEALGEGGWLGHGGDIHLAEINIPLIFYSRSHAFPEREIPYATLIDIAPSLLALLDLPAPDTWSGMNLFKERRTYSYHMRRSRGGNNSVLFYRDEQPYLYSRHRNSGIEQIFNLALDPYQKIGFDYPEWMDVKRQAREYYRARFGDIY